MKMHRPNTPEVAARASRPPSPEPTRCIASSCTSLTQRSIGNGLSDLYCKRHIEFIRRHGSSWQRSYKVSEIKPYRKAARKWLNIHRKDQDAAMVISRLDAWIGNAGPSKSAYDLRWLTPDQRAQQVIARLREAGIKGERLLEITLIIKATMRELGPRANPEFQYVQIAKLAHRLNSGTQIASDIYNMPRKYPRPDGRFMRVLGKWIEDVAAIVATPEVISEVIEIAGQNKHDIEPEPHHGIGPTR